MKCRYQEWKLEKGVWTCSSIDKRSWEERHPVLAKALMFFVFGIIVTMFTWYAFM